MHKDKPLLIGAHTSAAGGVHNAILEAHEIGATTFQFFTRNQKRWENKEISDEEAALWFETLDTYPMQQIMSHDSYLINLGCPHAENLEKSQKAFREELKRCQKLQVSYLNFHPGAALDGGEEACLKTIVHSLKKLSSLAEKGPTRLLIETTAGQGSCVGYRFEQIGYLIGELKDHLPIGVCIDTCHIFSAGYDIRTSQAWDHTLKEFDEQIGLKYLFALHVNDSMKPFGQRKDRHAPLGEGEIGIEAFKVMMRHPALAHLPKYLETPDGPPLWKKEIAMLKRFVN